MYLSSGAGSSARVVRGGSWNNNPENCLAAYRNRNAPGNRNNNLGLRVCFRLHGRLVPAWTSTRNGRASTPRPAR